MNRMLMDKAFKPFLIKSVIVAGKMFGPDDPKVASTQGMILNEIFNHIIKSHESRGNTRMVEFYKALKKCVLQIYTTDSYYSADFDAAFIVMARHRDFLARNYG